MGTYTLGFDKKYKCVYCDKSFNDVDSLIENNWRCPICNEHIYISAPRLNSGHTLIRKQVSELEKYDIVHLPGNQDTYNVIAITPTNDNRVRVSLKNFGNMTYNTTDFVSVVEGGYYESDWI